MTQLDDSPSTPSPDSSSSSSSRPSPWRDLGAFLLAAGTVAALTGGWFRGLFEKAPPWMAPTFITFAGLGATEKARILGSIAGTAVRRLLPTKKE